MAFVLAHLSDPHLAPLQQPRLYELAGKRIGGFINWQRNRRNFHLTAVLDRILQDLRSQAVDHLAVTGDLINLSLAAEFAPARAWLERLGSSHDVTLVPGNHDTYVRSKARHPERFWAAYMRGDAVASPEVHRPETTFPFLRRRGPLALIGLTTAVPAPWFKATGLLGEPQLARFADLLDSPMCADAFRVVLIHHPPTSSPADRDHRLIDGAAFLDVLRQRGAELVLHGHEHVHRLQWFDGPNGPVPSVGVPSASATVGGRYDAAAYNLYAVEGVPGSWRCEMVSRGLSADGESVGEIKRLTLAGH